MRHSRSHRTGTLLVVCVVSAFAGFAIRPNGTGDVRAGGPAAAQSDQKLVQRYDFGNEPIEFSRFKINNMPIVANVKFSAVQVNRDGNPADWLKGLQFDIKNVSGREITCVGFEFQFPETDVTGSRYIYNGLRIGLPPPNVPSTVRKSDKPFSLKNGDSATFRLSDDELQGVKDFLAAGKIDLANINHIGLMINYIYFSDAVRWSGRDYYRPVLNAPGKYERIKPNTQ